MTIFRRVDDRTLLRLAWLAPLLLIALNQWRSSLETSYLPPRVETADLSLERLEPALAHWLKQTGYGPEASRIVAVVDPDCPCTQPALRALRKLLTKGRGVEPPLVFIHTAARYRDEDDQSAALLAEIPATPTLLVMVDGRLRYAGPITEGGACGATVRQVLNTETLSSARTAPMRGVASSGCYCRHYTGRTGSSPPQLSTTPQPRVS